MREEINPYAAPASISRERAAGTDERSWILRTVRVLTIGPALMFLVLLVFGSFANPALFLPVVAAMALLHFADRAFFKSKRFVG